MSKIDDTRIRGLLSARNVILGGAAFFSFLLVSIPASAAQAALTVFLIVSAIWLRLISRNQLDTIQIVRTHHPRVFEGERVPVLLRLRRGEGLPILMLELRDQFFASIQHDQRQLVPVLTGGWEVLLHYEHAADRHRGLYTLGPILLRAGDPLGVFFEDREVPTLSDLTIYPKSDPLPFYRVPGPHPSAGHSMDFVPRLGYGEEILSVREYHPGDPPARVHWRTSARRGHLHVVQLNRPVQVELTVMADLTRRSRFGLGAEATTELAIRAAISILTRACEARHRFSLVYAHEKLVCFPAGSGLAQLHMLADRLAILSPGGETDFWEACAPRALALAPGSRAVLIATALGTPPAATADLIRRLATGLVAVDFVLIDEHDFIRIWRDQETDLRKAPPVDFARLAGELSRAGARVYPLRRTQPHLVNAECGMRNKETIRYAKVREEAQRTAKKLPEKQKVDEL